MLLSIASRNRQDLQISPVIRVEIAAQTRDDSDIEQKAQLRRQMYERIVRGNALAEAEEDAHRKRRGQ
jgi:hypothetical protein